MNQQIAFTNIDLNKFTIYQDTQTKNFLALTPEEAHRIQQVIAREQSQGTQHKDIDPAAVVEGIKLTLDPLANIYRIADTDLITCSICNLEYHEVKLITASLV